MNYSSQNIHNENPDSNLRSIHSVLNEINNVILGKEKVVREIMVSFLAGGHVLLTDMPGVGKTTLAAAFSKAMQLESRRVQFTPDVMPSDLTGFSIYNREQAKFVYQPGTLFCNILLADEINRTSPKTQSALLEAMEEKHVTVEGTERSIPDPFLVIATENPLGSAGTQPLPESQLDRFMVSLSIGYPDRENELALAKSTRHENRADIVEPVISREEFLTDQQSVRNVYISDEIYEYIVNLVTATRSHPDLEYGAGPRGTIALVNTARASAWLDGRNFVIPQDIVDQFYYVIPHRAALTGRARVDHVEMRDVLKSILQDTAQPVLAK